MARSWLDSRRRRQYTHRMPQVPSGAVTFLFTDIEGSTRLLKELRDEYPEALEEHQRRLRSAFDEAGGREIDTQGDAFFVVFHRARDAVVAALVGQRSLTEHEWPQGSQLRVRMGIHTGEASVSGERYLGVAVHRAARICAAGHGGQVLVSQTAKNVLEDEEVELPDVDFRDLGEQRLKDLDRPVRLYQLIAPGLAEEFPPLRTADTPFAGREGELAKAAEDVPGSRLGKRSVLAAATVGAIVIVGVVAGVLMTSGSARGLRSCPRTASGDRSSERQRCEPRRGWQSTSNRRRDAACRTVDRRRIGRGMGRESE